MTAGLIVASMITPIITSITREVFLTVPGNDKDGALALGASRWEMIRGVVLSHSSGGIVGAVMLGLGRAMGETIAIALVIGANPQIVSNLFAAGRGDAGGDRPQPAASHPATSRPRSSASGSCSSGSTIARQRGRQGARGPHRTLEGRGVTVIEREPTPMPPLDLRGSTMSAGRRWRNRLATAFMIGAVPHRSHPARVRPRDRHQQGHSPSSASTGSRRTSPTWPRARWRASSARPTSEPVVYGMAPAIVGTLLSRRDWPRCWRCRSASSARST